MNKAISSLYEELSSIEDFRQKSKVRHRLGDVLLIATMAMLSGSSTCTEMEFYAKTNLAYFQNLLKLKEVPSHDTFSRIFRLISALKLSSTIENWLDRNFPEQYETYGGRNMIVIDGKAIRASTAKGAGEHTRYILNYLISGGSMRLVIKKVGEKRNEISTIPEYMETIDVAGKYVSIDAIATHCGIIEQIIASKGFFLFRVKDNNRLLKEAIDERVAELKASGEFANLDKYSEVEKGHGRIESRTLSLIHDTTFLIRTFGYGTYHVNIARIGTMEKSVTRMVDGAEEKSTSTEYIITNSESITAEDMYRMKRRHWDIESSHYILDESFREDLSTSRKDSSIENLAVARRFALRIFEFEKASSKGRISARMFTQRCMCKKGYLEGLLGL